MNIFLLLAVLLALLWAFYLWSRPQTSLPPAYPPWLEKFGRGGCWRTILDVPASHFYPSQGYIQGGQVRNLMQLAGRNRIRVIRRAVGVYHILPRFVASKRAKRITFRKLVTNRFYLDAYYGAADIDIFTDSPQRHAVLSPLVTNFLRYFQLSNRTAPFQVPSRLLPLLTRAGIAHPNEFALPHVHPVHATLEADQLRFVDKFLSRKNWYALWLRPEKAATMTTPPRHSFNPTMVARDVRRFYDSTNVDQAPSSSCKIWFVHDTLQNLSPAYVGSWFDRHPHLTYLIATGVIPTESAHYIPSFWPSLYTLSYHKLSSLLRYVPEGDYGGSYIQPVQAYRWLTASKLITPQGECLHVGLVNSRFAHQTIIISRPQLLSQDFCSVDRPALTVIPRWAAPFESLSSRITTPELLERLNDFSSSFENLRPAEIFTKLRQVQMPMGQLLPSSYKEAAVNYVGAQRALNARYAASSVHRWYYVISVLFKFPLLPISALSASLVRFVRPSFPVDTDLFGRCGHVLTQWDMPSVSPGSQLCDLYRLPLHYIPHNASLLGRVYIRLVHFQLFFVLKFCLGFLAAHPFQLVPRVMTLYSFFAFRLSITLQSYIMLFFVACLSISFDLDIPDVSLYTNNLLVFLLSRVVLAARVVWGLFWGLPSTTRNKPIGYCWAYRLLICWFWFGSLFANFFYPLPSPGQMATANPFYFPLFILIFFSLLQLEFGRRRTYRWDRMPFHSDLEHGDQESTTYQSFESITASTHSTELAVTESALSFRTAPNSLASAITEFFSPPPTSPSLIPMSTEFETASEAPPSVVLPEPQVMQPAAPFQALIPPAAFPTVDLFSATLRRLPLPPNPPPANRMCVWDVLSFSFPGVAPESLHANFVADHGRAALVDNGAPFLDSLAAVFTFYRTGATIYRATRNANGVLVATPADYAAPLRFGQSEANWPTIIASLEVHPQAPGQYHLVAQMPELRVDAPALPMPFAGARPLVGLVSRFVGLAEMRYAMNLPVQVYQRVYQCFNGFGQRAASLIAQQESFDNAPFPQPGLPPPIILPERPLEEEIIEYTSTAQDLREARDHAADLKTFPQWIDTSDADKLPLARSLSTVLKYAQPRTATFHLYHGLGGTGKSTAFVEKIRDLLAQGVSSQQIAVLSSSPVLLGELQADIGGQIPMLEDNSFLFGYKVFLHGAAHLFVDDATKFTPGFLQMVMAYNAHVSNFYLSFDCAQNSPPAANLTSRSVNSRFSRDWLSTLSSKYATNVRRSSVEFCRLFGLPDRFATTHGEVRLCSQGPNGVPLLVASPKYAVSKSAGGTKCYNFADVQGLTFNGDCAIDFGGLTSGSTDASAWTTLTRARGSNWIVLPPPTRVNTLLDETSFGSSGIFSAICAVAAQGHVIVNAETDVDHIVARAFQSHLATSLSAQIVRDLGLNPPAPVVGAVVHPYPALSDASKLHSQSYRPPYVTPRSFLAKGQSSSGNFLAPPRVFPGMDRHEKVVELMKYNMPLTRETAVSAKPSTYVIPAKRAVECVVDPVRELRSKPLDPDFEVSGGTGLPAQTADPFGPPDTEHHKGTDEALFHHSLPLRIPVKKETGRLFGYDYVRLRQLKRGFKKFFTAEKEAFNELKFEDSFVHCAESWFAGKTIRDMQRSIEQWAPDADPYFIPVFQKGQWIKKLEARGQRKKSQIITRVPHFRVFQDSVYAHYLQEYALKTARPTTLFNIGLNPTQIKEWYSNVWDPTKKVVANDYTGWDTGMDRVFLHFDLWLMRQCGIPDHYCHTYYDYKVNSRFFKGPFPIMQHSGDRFTFLLNSLRNAAIVGASINCPTGTPAAFAGDDSVVQGSFGRERNFIPGAWSLTPKRVVSNSSEFCAWRFGLPELSISLPSVVYRCQIALARGVKSPDYWRSMCDLAREADGTPEQFGDLELVLRRVVEVFGLALDWPFIPLLPLD